MQILLCFLAVLIAHAAAASLSPNRTRPWYGATLSTTVEVPGGPSPSSTSTDQRRTAGTGVLAGAFIVQLDQESDFTEEFVRELNNLLGSDIQVRANLTSLVFNGLSIQLSESAISSGAVARVAKIPRVQGVYPVKVHTPPIVERATASARNGKSQYYGVDEASRRTERRAAPPQTKLNYHIMSQVDELQSRNISGRGVKIAIIDAEIDYKHPSLGGCIGPGCLVSFGKSFLEDEDTKVYNPSCLPHATLLAGVIIAQPGSPGGLVGVAPGATFGRYAIAGCKHNGNDEKLLAALGQAVADGVDILVYSIGSGSEYVQEHLNYAWNKVAEHGILAVTSAGNSGNQGIFHAQDPSSAVDVLGAGSVDSSETIDIAYLATYITSESTPMDFVWRNGTAGPHTVGWESVVLALWTDLRAATPGNECSPLLDNTPDLSNRIVLVKGSNCSDFILAANAVKKGARYILISNEHHEQSLQAPQMSHPDIKAIAMVDHLTGEKWTQLLDQGIKVIVNMTTDSSRFTLLTQPSGLAMRMSPYSQWGPTLDGYLNTKVSAPGSGILTTTCMALGAYETVSGTSIAAPYLAGMAALVAEARKTTDWKVLSSLLVMTAKPLLHDHGRIEDSAIKGGLASVAQQGGGMAQALNAAVAPIVLSRWKLEFNDTAHRADLNFTIKNLTPLPITYQVSNMPAVTVYTLRADKKTPLSYNDILSQGGAILAPATLELRPGLEIKVPGNGEAYVEVRARDPKRVDLNRLPVFSGFLRLSSSDGSAYTLPYLGSAGSLHNAPTLHTLQSSNAQQGKTIRFPGENAIFFIGVGLATEQLRFLVVDARMKMVLGAPSGIDDLGEVTRLNKQLEWDGRLRNGTAIATGEYQLMGKALKPFGAPEKADDWTTLLSPTLTVAWNMSMSTPMSRP